jgi:protoporphyrinogen oxidase
MRVGVVGGGLMGLTLAWRLAKRGHAVTVFERDMQVGGLTTFHDYGPFFWDRFYHVILPTDTHLIRLLDELGLAGDLRWQRTLTGFYVDKQFYSLSSSWEFLTFPPLSLVGKARLALTILYCARLKDWKALEKIPVEEWLIKLCGHRTYHKIWKPLLMAKLGPNYRKVSAVFIWSIIKRMYSARDASAQKEHLGYVSGGYKSVLERLETAIIRAGGDIRTGTNVKAIVPTDDSDIRVSSGDKDERFDRVVFTGPLSMLRNVCTNELATIEGDEGKVEYLGVICGVLVSQRPLSPYYVLNIADERVPFTGIMGMSNLVSRDETNGYCLTYLPKYVMSDDPLLRADDRELTDLFMNGIRKVFPDVENRGLVRLHINRAFKVQPLQVLNYSRIAPASKTKHPSFFILNTSQFLNATLNNNEVIRMADAFLETHSNEFH